MARKRPAPSIALPTHGGEYVQLEDGAFEPTPAELARRAQAELDAAPADEPSPDAED